MNHHNLRHGSIQKFLVSTLILLTSAGCSLTHSSSAFSGKQNLGSDTVQAPVVKEGSSPRNSTPSYPAVGAQRTVVVVANFADSNASGTTVSVDDYQIPGTMDLLQKYIKQVSFGKAWLQGVAHPDQPMDIVGPLTLSTSSSTCGIYSYSEAATLARASGHALNQYDRILLLTPQSSCPSQGGISFVGKIFISDGVNFLSAGISQFDGSYHFNGPVVIHEFGHNLGLYHAKDANGYEYGDNYDVMGDYWSMASFNPFNKETLGWLPTSSQSPGSSPWTEQVSTDGIYTLEDYSSVTASGLKALKIPRSTSTGNGSSMMYLQYHTVGGFDSKESAGMLVHFATAGDATSSQWLRFNGSSDGVLHAGDSYTDSVSGTTVRVIGFDGGNLQVSVTGVIGGTGSQPIVTPVPTPQPTPSPTPRPDEGSVKAIQIPSDSFRSNFYDSSGKLLLSRKDSAVNFNWGSGSPDAQVPVDHFSAQFDGNINFSAGVERFTVTADDGVRLSIDNQIVIDHWVDQGATTYSVDLILTAGTHLVHMDYYENGGDAVAQLSYTLITSGSESSGGVGGGGGIGSTDSGKGGGTSDSGIPGSSSGTQLNKTFTAGSLLLTAGQKVNLEGGYLIFQNDGNLVLYNSSNSALWASNTWHGQGYCSSENCRAEFQTDGNFVVYQNGQAVWNSGTWNQGAGSLSVSAEAPYLSIRNSSNQQIWQSN